MINARAYRRRCRQCWESAEFALPPAPKSVVYLDQNVISNFVKAFDPAAAGGREVDPFWLELFQEIDLLCRLQALICPDSQTHREESAVTPFAERLHEIYRHLSYGATFDFTHAIRDRQLLAYLDNWLDDRPDEAPPIERIDAVNGQLEGWQERYRIDFPWRDDAGWVDELRAVRGRTDTMMVELHERWRTSQDFRFEDTYRRELRSFGTTLLQLHAAHVRELVEMQRGLRPFDPERALPPPATDFVLAARRRMRDHGVADADLWGRLQAFLEAPTLDLVPYLRISTLLWAALARKAAAGQRRAPSHGMMNDVKTVAIVLPYCDAVFVDNELAGLLGEGPLRTDIAYGTRVFSLNSRDDFLAFLRERREELSDEYVEKIKEVYGENWIRPIDRFFRE